VWWRYARDDERAVDRARAADVNGVANALIDDDDGVGDTTTDENGGAGRPGLCDAVRRDVDVARIYDGDVDDDADADADTGVLERERRPAPAFPFVFAAVENDAVAGDAALLRERAPSRPPSSSPPPPSPPRRPLCDGEKRPVPRGDADEPKPSA
jgi:hypothetical protein